MIDKRYGKFVPVCDDCNKELPAEDSWPEAVEATEKAHWVYDGDDVHHCPACCDEGYEEEE